MAPLSRLTLPCSSGLVALHIARIASFNTAKESLRQLAGGVNMVLRAETSALFTAAQMISPDGRCKTLDAAANGYVRGEACVVVILEPRLDTSNGQFCFMIVVGSATNQDGRSSTITAPNGTSPAIGNSCSESTVHQVTDGKSARLVLCRCMAQVLRWETQLR